MGQVKSASSQTNPGLFARLKQGLGKTRSAFAANLDHIFSGSVAIDEDLFTELEEALIMADVGMATTTRIMDNLRTVARQEKVAEPGQLKERLLDLLVEMLKATPAGSVFNPQASQGVYLIVGVNGVGKTTTIAKLAGSFQAQNQSVLLVAADTFRAAATEQLLLWGERLRIPVIHHQEGADPAAVVFDGMAAAKSRRSDLVLIDTAGRLHTKVNLMEELKKVKRVVSQQLEGRTLRVILVIDATTGQNAVNQTEVFHEALGVDGLILTKLDGTAKGGIVVALADRFRIPICYIGVGEQAEDLQVFDPEAFVRALFE